MIKLSHDEKSPEGFGVGIWRKMEYLCARKTEAVMIISKAQFKFSSSKLQQIPDDGMVEFAFIGRSNVGKSSLINMLVQRPLAKVSGTPGKTRLINHFLINDSWYLVDLPGYGYARVSQGERRGFAKLIMDYVRGSRKMHYLFVLVDSRHEPQKIDMEFINMLGENAIPFGLVFTKCDKLSAAQLKRNVENYCRTLSEPWEELPQIFLTSSAGSGRGRDEILDFIDKCFNEC